ncbi:MAG: hypothetical protein CMH57_14415 [Myxococcales bacterium]|nr:hypothetical protein [Myxococcales bacterium]
MAVIVAALWVVTAGGALIGCGDDGGDGGGEQDAGESNTTSTRPEGLRVFYSLATPESVDITLIDNNDDGNTIELQGVTRNVATDYNAIPAGDYRAIFLVSGSQEPLRGGTSVNNITVGDGETWTLVLTEDEGGDPVHQMIQDELTAPGENSARYRFVYRASGPRADLYELPSGALLEQGLALGQLTLYTDVVGGTYDFEVRPEGLNQVIHSIEQVDLKPGEIYTFFIVGNGDPNGDGNSVDSSVDHVQVLDWRVD